MTTLIDNNIVRRSSGAANLAVAALIGLAIAFVLSALAPLMTPNSNAVADTISDVAAGPFDWVQDAALHIEALALAALAIAMFVGVGRGLCWKLACMMLLAMAAALMLMASVERYSKDAPQGIVIHSYLVYTYGFAFIALLLTTLPVLRRWNSFWVALNLIGGVAWIAVAVFYFNMGTGWDGLVERLLGTLQFGWVALFAWTLRRENIRMAYERSSPSR
ncbi:DUF998 domain-containing protein [Pseudahrensia aquimaris]|uniref:DUF998 domain-containing protein n=1 Tax=Pseudahrensia aquimaris TaxID=744461 RepID=A0ABW3FHT5_9HYPH